ncbi:type III pantothenate kinase [Glaciecola sp. KUL10]|uniref:type III pantothenate kinase n=1 Tax=Glaciecola sp. (strain KUL10) TaxID=2161813 RepID=UPI000D784AD9|nr:type III pantothenate kinase [Glaciecola sp. KUL10]GBL06129.1 type III pantothenate kinase [Glaciecola sp. KUL10]
MTSLLLDVGNTHVHYCVSQRAFSVHESPDIQHIRIDQLQGLFDSLLSRHSAIEDIYLANVNNRACEALVTRLCEIHGLSLICASTQSSSFGLSNSYQTPLNMGVDRWLAMLACHNMILSNKETKDFIVFDLGTAITTDVVNDGKHIGGWIAPGYQTLKSGLLKNTSKVFADNSKKDYSSWFGNDTPDCVELGLRSQIQGGFELAVQEVSKRTSNFKIYVTGGDRHMINLDKYPMSEIHENLVLHGLSLYID